MTMTIRPVTTAAVPYPAAVPAGIVAVSSRPTEPSPDTPAGLSYALLDGLAYLLRSASHILPEFFYTLPDAPANFPKSAPDLLEETPGSDVHHRKFSDFFQCFFIRVHRGGRG